MVMTRDFSAYLTDLRIPFDADKRAQLAELPEDLANNIYNDRYEELLLPLSDLLEELSNEPRVLRTLAWMMVQRWHGTHLGNFARWFLMPFLQKVAVTEHDDGRWGDLRALAREVLRTKWEFSRV